MRSTQFRGPIAHSGFPIQVQIDGAFFFSQFVVDIKSRLSKHSPNPLVM
jgi:hypothetical protein